MYYTLNSLKFTLQDTSLQINIECDAQNTHKNETDFRKLSSITTKHKTNNLEQKNSLFQQNL